MTDYEHNGTDLIYRKRGSTEQYYVRTATGQIIAELNPNATGGSQVLNFEFSTTGTTQLEIEHDGQTETFNQSGSTEVSATALHDGIRLKPSTNSGEVHLTDLSFENNEPVPYINLLAGGVVGQKRFEGGVDQDYYYLKDHLGSTRVILHDNNGTAEVTATNDYYPFGKILRNAGSATSEENKYKFTGWERDIETDLDYAGARYYDFDIGRWFGVDPFGIEFPSLNPYNYAANSPIILTDPNGERIEISDEMADNQALLDYAQSEEGRSYLAQFAEEGETIIINGVEITFENAGEFADQVLKFAGFGNNETIPVNSTKGDRYVSAEGEQSYNVYIGKNLSKLEQSDAIFHEVQHAYLFASAGTEKKNGEVTNSLITTHHKWMLYPSHFESGSSTIYRGVEEFPF